MSILTEIDDLIDDFKITNLKEIKIIEDYFNFKYDDIELNLIAKILTEGKNSELLNEVSSLTNSSEYDIFYESLLGKHEFIQNQVEEDFKEIYSKISDHYMKTKTYPHLENTLKEIVKSIMQKYKKEEYKHIHFFVLLLSKRKIIRERLTEFYKNKFKGNFKSNDILINNNQESNNLINLENQQEIMSKDSNTKDNISSSITLEILKSHKFSEYQCELAKWYSFAECINLNLFILNEYFNFKLEFSQEKFSLNENLGFSLKSFAKKSLLKLLSYCLKKCNLQIKAEDIDYQKILLNFATAFTCGFSLGNIFFKNVKQLAILGGFLFNIFVNKISNNIDDLSDSVDFDRLMKILNKLNKKLSIIEKKIYKILKFSLKNKLLNFIGVTYDSNQIQKMEEKKNNFIQLLAKYLKGTENFNEEQEKDLLRESFGFNSEIENTINENKIIDENWVILNMNKNGDEEEKVE